MCIPVLNKWFYFYEQTDRSKEKMEEAEEKQLKQIKENSAFVLDDALERKEKIKFKLQQLNKDLDAGFDLNEENIRAYNFISYLFWKLGEREKAFEAIEKAEELDKELNVISLCNKIMFHHEAGEYSQSHDLQEIFRSTHLKQKRAQIRAKADMGYFYSRLGPKYHAQAVRFFRSAIRDTQPERNILWEFGLALTLRRQSHMFQMTDPKNFEPENKKREAANLLYGVVKFPTQGQEYHQIRGKAWCELGKIMTKKENLSVILDNEETDTSDINQNWCFEEALTLCPNDYFILQSYGQQLRYSWDLEKSKEMLERAISIKDMPFSRHHLAVTLKKIVEKNISTKRKCRKNLDHSFSVDDRQGHQKQAEYDSGVYSMESQLSSLSLGEHGSSPSTDGRWRRGNTSSYQKSRHASQRLSGPVENTPSRYSYQRQRNIPFLRSQSDSEFQKRSFSAMRKSPKSVCVSLDHPLLLEAVEHLKIALKMDDDFNVARYELGLIYRMLDQTNEALVCFSRISSGNCGKLSEYKMTLINAYEQQGLCKLEMKSKETDPTKQRKLEFDAQQSMWKAISVVSSVIGAIPMMKTSSHCFPTLKSLLLKEEESPKNFGELAKLHELLEFNEESIKFYRKMIEKEVYDAKTVKQLIQNYIKVGDFENAICTLSLLQCTGELDVFDKTFYVDTYTKGANDSVENHDIEMAKVRLLKAYQTIFSHHSSSVSCPDGDAQSPDILMLHSCEKGEGCRQLKQIAGTFNEFVELQIDVNHNDCPPYSKKSAYLKKRMLECRCVLVFFHETENADTESTDPTVDSAIDLIIPLKQREKTLVIRNGETDDDLLSCRHCIRASGFDAETEDSNLQAIWHVTIFSDILKKMSEMF